MVDSKSSINIKRNIRFPEGISFPTGKVVAQFTIQKDGRIGDVKILKDIGHGIG